MSAKKMRVVIMGVGQVLLRCSCGDVGVDAHVHNSKALFADTA